MNRFRAIFLNGGMIARLAVVLVMLSSCSREDLSGVSVEKGVTLRAECLDMLPQFADPLSALSRASDNKTAEEKAVRTLHLFFFDAATGEFLEPEAGDQNFHPYQKISTNVLTIKDKAFTQMTGVQVYAIANISGSHFNTKWTPGGDIKTGMPDGTKADFEVRNRDDLMKWVYAPVLRSEEGTDVNHLPKAGMPMAGWSDPNEPIDLNAQSGNLLINMKAMMARVDITVKLNPNQENREGTLPMMTIREYGVRNMPTMVPLVPPTGEDEEHVTVYPVEESLTVPVNVTINKDSEPVRFSYYTYENVQRAAKEADNASITPGENGEWNYPEGVKTDEEKQRWKPTIAKKDRASALQLKGSYTTHQGLNYNAEFTVYMGANPVNDFKVERNRQYSNNISIRGLDYVRNSTDNVYTYDGRVNVVTDNPLYLAIVNERKVDAHASALPMDVWLLLREPEDASQLEQKEVEHESTVTISIPDGCDWVRMERVISREEMCNSGWQPGTGIQPYFTTDMFERVATAKSLTIDGGNVSTGGSRSRVYFYIDENVTPNGNGDVPERHVPISVVYVRKDKDGVEVDRRERTLEIEQRGLLHVSGNWVGNNNVTYPIDTYMEYYEEYLEHSDPLDQHLQPGELYEGLNWGLDGVDINRRIGNSNGFNNPESGNDYYQVYYPQGAFAMTQWAIGRDGAVSMSSVKLFNDEEPASAFHYCYGKNKRNADGSVVSAHWYMPGIRELERALVQYYLTFEDFQGELYWSASCTNQGTLNNNRNYARATRVTMNSEGRPTYVESANSGDLGYQRRTARLRIRAFYRM